jgi:hypothetical protein
VEVVFQVYEISSNNFLGHFSKEEGSSEAYDEVLSQLQPVMAKLSSVRK